MRFDDVDSNAPFAPALSTSAPAEVHRQGVAQVRSKDAADLIAVELGLAAVRIPRRCDLQSELRTV